MCMYLCAHNIPFSSYVGLLRTYSCMPFRLSIWKTTKGEIYTSFHMHFQMHIHLFFSTISNNKIFNISTTDGGIRNTQYGALLLPFAGCLGVIVANRY